MQRPPFSTSSFAPSGPTHRPHKFRSLVLNQLHEFPHIIRRPRRPLAVTYSDPPPQCEGMDDNPWGTESPPTVVSTLIATPTSTGTKALSQHDDDIVGTVLIDAEEALEQEREEEREKDNAIIASTLTPSLEESIPAVSVAVETPMDDFSDDDETTMGNAAAETEGAHELIADDDAFDEDDFGEMGGDDANDDDDFGDFGDVDSTAFEPAVIEHFPVASTSAIPYPPLQLDLSTPTALAMAPQLDDFFERMYPRARETLSDEPERQVDGIGQVLVTESL